MLCPLYGEKSRDQRMRVLLLVVKGEINECFIPV